jgi:competence protein ComEA
VHDRSRTHVDSGVPGDSEPEELIRPEPFRGLPERTRAWVGWVGLDRLIASAVAVAIVCGGAYWLVRSSPPPTEAALPMVATSAPGDVAAAPTLPPPASDGAAPGEAGPPITSAQRIVVHVAGAVASPGVYDLAAGVRIDDVIAAAGGVVGTADPDALNLAAVVVDGTRVYVPTVGEEVDEPIRVDRGSAVGVPSGASEVAGPIDVNRATAAELESLPGVGPATATAIVAERERNGPFLDVDDLDRVPGIGPAKLAAIRELVIT